MKIIKLLFIFSLISVQYIAAKSYDNTIDNSNNANNENTQIVKPKFKLLWSGSHSIQIEGTFDKDGEHLVLINISEKNNFVFNGTTITQQNLLNDIDKLKNNSIFPFKYINEDMKDTILLVPINLSKIATKITLETKGLNIQSNDGTIFIRYFWFVGDKINSGYQEMQAYNNDRINISYGAVFALSSGGGWITDDAIDISGNSIVSDNISVSTNIRYGSLAKLQDTSKIDKFKDTSKKIVPFSFSKGVLEGKISISYAPWNEKGYRPNWNLYSDLSIKSNPFTNNLTIFPSINFGLQYCAYGYNKGFDDEYFSDSKGILTLTFAYDWFWRFLKNHELKNNNYPWRLKFDAYLEIPKLGNKYLNYSIRCVTDISLQKFDSPNDIRVFALINFDFGNLTKTLFI